MKELTTLEYRKCCVLLCQWRAELRNRDQSYGHRMLMENIEYVRTHGHNPPFPEKRDEDMVRVRVRGRRRHFGITPRMLGCWTVERGLIQIGASKDLIKFIRRHELGSRGPDVANHSEKPVFAELGKLFDWFLRVGFADERFEVSERALLDSKRMLRDLDPDYKPPNLNLSIITKTHSDCE